MPTLTYQYVYFASGPHSRQPRTPSGPGGFALIQTLPGGTLSSGDTFVASPQPASQEVGADSFPFAFVNVTGGTQGGQTSFKAGVPAPSMTVGTANIVVLVVYAPAGGSGPGSTGATIDSFDMSTGSLFNDTFVTVSPDTGGTLTTSGNKEGYVDTTNSAETIAAIGLTAPTGVDFVEWLTLPQTVSTSPHLVVGKGVSLEALAFYQTPVVVPPVVDPCKQAFASLEQIIVDGDRPRLTVVQFNALQAQLETCVHEGKLTQSQVNTAIAQYKAQLNEPTPPPVHQV